MLPGRGISLRQGKERADSLVSEVEAAALLREAEVAVATVGLVVRSITRGQTATDVPWGRRERAGSEAPSLNCSPGWAAQKGSAECRGSVRLICSWHWSYMSRLSSFHVSAVICQPHHFRSRAQRSIVRWLPVGLLATGH